MSTTQPDKEVGRFVVIDTNPTHFEVTLFDKQKQSDFIDKVWIEIGAGAVQLLGAVVIAWLITGTVLKEASW